MKYDTRSLPFVFLAPVPSTVLGKFIVVQLIFNYPFSQACWIYWDTNLAFRLMVLKARQEFGRSFFREVVLIVSWAIWCHTNSILFDGGSLLSGTALRVPLNKWENPT
jgi:hypothetical protein